MFNKHLLKVTERETKTCSLENCGFMSGVCATLLSVFEQELSQKWTNGPISSLAVSHSFIRQEHSGKTEQHGEKTKQKQLRHI